ncbi:MAG: hypothetical protein LBK52_04175, partial [Deltaproteobacteria bacterium]|nr:hypothetical protein [Deltaproteobacteria bacterium]
MAADGGARHLVQLGWPAHILAGDMDSCRPETVQSLPKAQGYRQLIYPREKDEIDFEILLALALEKLEAGGEITVLGALGGRWDMTAANLWVPFADKYLKLWPRSRITFRTAETDIFGLQGPSRL